MTPSDNDLFPALLAAALYARRKGDDGPSNLDGLLEAPTRPLDFTPGAAEIIDEEAGVLELAA